ncbi:MAG TPA: hypothetical protein VGT78_01600 [Rhizomicrobium sp.]|nr:hypothetical protein [Rhizomicrobium sp.]
MTGSYKQGRIAFVPISLFAVSLLATMPVAVPAVADESCTYESAFSVDGGQVHRQGDTIIIEVWGQAPADGWTNPKLAIVPEDTNPIKVAYRLMGCAPNHESGGLQPMRAMAFVVANPGRIQSIVVRSSTNDVRLHDGSL